MAKKMTRTELRENLYRMLFCLDFYQKEELAGQQELYLEAMPQIAGKDRQELQDKFRQIAERIEEIDTRIEEKSNGWKTSRMAKADLSVLRLAVYEMLYDDVVPTGVAINEAVELAKAYGGEKSTAFVNGILASIARELPEHETAGGQEKVSVSEQAGQDE